MRARPPTSRPSAIAGAWAPAAGRLMADLGFSLIRSDRPEAPGGAHLLVALRATPTLRHFDPEAVSYWAPVAGRGRIAVVDRRTELPFEGPVSWGTIRVVDRLGEDNRFLTFGGTMRAIAADPDETLAMHASPAPLVRWSGHSQGLDPLAGEIGAFFARLMVRVDFEPGVEGGPGRRPAARCIRGVRVGSPPAPGRGSAPGRRRSGLHRQDPGRVEPARVARARGLDGGRQPAQRGRPRSLRPGSRARTGAVPCPGSVPCSWASDLVPWAGSRALVRSRVHWASDPRALGPVPCTGPVHWVTFPCSGAHPRPRS